MVNYTQANETLYILVTPISDVQLKSQSFAEWVIISELLFFLSGDFKRYHSPKNE